MTNILFYIPTSLNSPEFEILLSKAQNFIKQGKKVTILTCAGGNDYACSINIYSNPLICTVCNNCKKNSFSKIKGEFELMQTSNNLIKKKIDFSNVDQLKRFKLKGVDIGLSAYSSYLDNTKDVFLEGKISKKTLQKIISVTINLSEFFLKLIKKKKIDVAYIFNGRQNQYRPLVRHLLKNKIKTICLEYKGPDDTNVYEFVNHLPHDYNYFAHCIEQYFKKQRLTKSKLRQKVKHYYRSIIKSKQIEYADGKSFVFNKNQKLGLLPKNFNEKDENIVFIISSEFEYVTLGDEYEDTIYKTQTEAIEKISQDLLKSKKKIKFWVRLHPNLNNVKWSYIQNFYNLEKKFKFVNVIPSNSIVSSFSLLLNCSKVITFGSRMGIEAVYARKPAIILFRNSYEKLNTQYIPKNHLEVMKLIFTDLKPKPILGAEKYALFESHGGKKEVGFKGSFTDGFTFYKNKTKKNAYNKIIYFVGRFIDKYYFFLLRNEGIKRSFKHFIFKLF